MYIDSIKIPDCYISIEDYKPKYGEPNNEDIRIYPEIQSPNKTFIFKPDKNYEKYKKKCNELTKKLNKKLPKYMIHKGYGFWFKNTRHSKDFIKVTILIRPLFFNSKCNKEERLNSNNNELLICIHIDEENNIQLSRSIRPTNINFYFYLQLFRDVPCYLEKLNLNTIVSKTIYRFQETINNLTSKSKKFLIPEEEIIELTSSPPQGVSLRSPTPLRFAVGIPYVFWRDESLGF